MTRQKPWVEGVLLAALALGACNRAPQDPPASVDRANTNVAAVSAPAADATSAVVGQVSAATTLTAAGFVTAAETGDMFEIAAARIAHNRAVDPALRKFAARMIRDHTASTAKLEALIASSHIDVTQPSDLDERRKGLIAALNTASHPDFDRTYLDQQVAAHQEAATLFKGYAEHGENAALKDFALATLPTIQEHLAMAKSMQDAMAHPP